MQFFFGCGIPFIISEPNLVRISSVPVADSVQLEFSHCIVTLTKVDSLEELNKIKKSYVKINNEYIKSEESIEKFLKYKDLVRHMRTYYILNLRHKKAFAAA